MFDTRIRRALAPTLDRVGGRLSDAGVPALALTAVGFAAGIAACVAAVFHAWPAALALWLANRVLDGLDGPVARRRGATDVGGFLDIVADFTVFAGFVVAVGVAQPQARLACLVLLMAYYVSGTAFLALSSLLERRGCGSRAVKSRAVKSRGGESCGGESGDGEKPCAAGRFADGRSLRFVGGLAEGTETVVVYVLFCVFPARAELIAWVFAAAVAVTAVQRVVLGVHLLRRPGALTRCV